MDTIENSISKAIWYGKIPIQFNLDPTDPTATAFIEVPRYSYLPLITPQILSHSKRLESSEPHTIWYEFNGEPLKWHFPIGLLYDMANRLGSTPPQLPWCINVHSNNFPDTVILRNPGLETIQDMYMSMIKEADFIRHGSTKKVMNLSKQDQSQLWQALSTERYDDYWHVNRHILDDRGAGLRSVPLRLYLPDHCPVIQDTTSFTDEQGASRTLGDILHSIVPSLFLADGKSTDLIVVLHGIQLPLHTPIRWASDHLSYPDNFLHLIICKSSPPSL